MSLAILTWLIVMMGVGSLTLWKYYATLHNRSWLAWAPPFRSYWHRYSRFRPHTAPWKPLGLLYLAYGFRLVGATVLSGLQIFLASHFLDVGHLERAFNGPVSESAKDLGAQSELIVVGYLSIVALFFIAQYGALTHFSMRASHARWYAPLPQHAPSEDVVPEVEPNLGGTEAAGLLRPGNVAREVAASLVASWPGMARIVASNVPQRRLLGPFAWLSNLCLRGYIRHVEELESEQALAIEEHFSEAGFDFAAPGFVGSCKHAQDATGGAGAPDVSTLSPSSRVVVLLRRYGFTKTLHYIAGDAERAAFGGAIPAGGKRRQGVRIRRAFRANVEFQRGPLAKLSDLPLGVVELRDWCLQGRGMGLVLRLRGGAASARVEEGLKSYAAIGESDGGYSGPPIRARVSIDINDPSDDWLVVDSDVVHLTAPTERPNTLPDMEAGGVTAKCEDAEEVVLGLRVRARFGRGGQRQLASLRRYFQRSV